MNWWHTFSIACACSRSLRASSGRKRPIILVPRPADEVDTVRWIYRTFNAEGIVQSKIAGMLSETEPQALANQVVVVNVCRHILVATYPELVAAVWFLVAEACNVPNALIVPFRIELFRPAA